MATDRRIWTTSEERERRSNGDNFANGPASEKKKKKADKRVMGCQSEEKIDRKSREKFLKVVKEKEKVEKKRCCSER